MNGVTCGKTCMVWTSGTGYSCCSVKSFSPNTLSEGKIVSNQNSILVRLLKSCSKHTGTRKFFQCSWQWLSMEIVERTDLFRIRAKVRKFLIYLLWVSSFSLIMYKFFSTVVRDTLAMLYVSQLFSHAPSTSVKMLWPSQQVSCM